MRSCWLIISLFWYASLNARELTIGSYNVENLWDTEASNTQQNWDSFLQSQPQSSLQKYSEFLTPQYASFSSHNSNWYNPAIASQKVDHLLHAIRLAGEPDVLGLQEIESAGNHSEVFAIRLPSGLTFKQELQQMGYVSFIIGPQNVEKPVSTTTAFISKVPLVELPSVPVQLSSSTLAARDIQVVQFEENEKYGEVFLVNGHWKANSTNRSKNLRLETAKILKEYLSELKNKHSQARIMMLGDLNAPYWEKSMQVLGATGQMAEDDQYYDLWFDVQEENRWESSYHGVREHLSHILIGEGFFEEKGLHYQAGSFRVVGQNDYASKFLIAANGQPFRWQYRLIGVPSTGYYEHLGFGYSDHLPIVATFEVPEGDLNEDDKPFENLGTGDVSAEVSRVKMLDSVRECQEQEIRDYRTLDFTHPKRLEGTCVYIEAPEPMQIWMDRGNYPTVTLPEGMFAEVSRAPKISLTMVRAYDYRPNLSDSRVNENDWIQADSEDWSSKKPHPKSNVCFINRILKSGKGRLKKAVGRLGYTGGAFHVHVLSRESEHLQLVDIPEDVLQECPW